MTPLAQAQANIKATLGLPALASDWTYDQRVSYNQALAQWIAANPDSVSTQDSANALAEMNANNSPLIDNGFLSDGSTFLGALGDEALAAGNDIGGIGRGVLNLASLSSWIIPVAGIIVVIILLFAFKKKYA